MTMNSDSARPADEELLKIAISNLKERGFIEYDGEYGTEIVTFIPFVAWLNQEGLLENRRVVTFQGMRPYYFFLTDDQFEAKPQTRRVRPEIKRKWPTNIIHSATRQRWHVFPDYRSHFKDRGRSFDRPILFIQNKFTVEWNTGPINYLPIFAIERLLRLSVNRFQVIYSRPRVTSDGTGYTGDSTRICEYPDLPLVRSFDNAIVLEEMCVDEGLDYNQAKLEILAKTHLFVSVQGGGASVLAYFGDSLMLVLHREGREFPHAYAKGPYKYLADPPPLLLVARDNHQLEDGIKIFAAASVEGGRPMLAKQTEPLVEALRM